MGANTFGDSITTARIGSFLTFNKSAIEQSYAKVATGKNVISVADNVGDFFRADQYVKNNSEYGKVSHSIDDVSGLLDYTEQANRMIWDDLYQMKSLVKDYYATTATVETQATIAKQFNDAKYRIVQTQRGAIYDGNEVLSDSSDKPIISINTNPHDLTQRYDVSFGKESIVDALLLDITVGESNANDALDEQTRRAGSFAGQLTGYRYGLNAQQVMSSIMAKGSESAYATIQNVDEAKEVISITKRTIQQQAATSMFAQAGMLKSNILKLFS